MQVRKVNMNKLINRFVAFGLLSAFIISGIPLTAKAQVRNIYDRGTAGLVRKLKGLQTTASAMHTAAHPDDEDSGLIARLARGDNARISYLSLTRGEGGQNVIGPELFESLGIIRTEELLQARRLDGGDQFFTRFMEYGFSKQRSEAARIWDEKAVLGDMVRAIRLYRPLVLISRFTGTPLDGHGQHQLAGYLTPIAFKAAADPNQFPEHFAEGLRPWQAKKLYRGSRGAEGQVVPTSLYTGEYDPVIGRTYFEIAMEGRSQHKCQEMGTIESRGDQTSEILLLDSLTGKSDKDSGVFDGIDTSISGIAKTYGVTDGSFDADLKQIEGAAAKALANFDALNPEKVVPSLVEGLRGVRKVRGAIASRQKTDALTDVDFVLAKKEKEFSEALQQATGVVVDALSNSETIVAGNTVSVAVKVFARKGADVKVGGSKVVAPNGWTTANASAPAAPTAGFRTREEKGISAEYFSLTAPANAVLTQPYWLVNPRKSFTFDWSQAGMNKNLPFDKEFALVETKLTIGGEELTVKKPIEYRFADDIRGELRRNLNVVPKVAVAFDSHLIIAPTSNKAQQRRVVLSITNNHPGAVNGTASLDLPSGWTATPASQPFSLKDRDQKTAVTFDITIPANAKVDSYSVVGNATIDGQKYNQTMLTVAYPHIQTHRRYETATVDAKVVDLKIEQVNVGYIMGSGDSVPEAIKLLGLPITMLEEKELTTGDLSKYDIIVVGIRASQVRPDFVANNGRLLDYVKNGGTLMVQYQQQEYARNNQLPFPANIGPSSNSQQRFGHTRVVDETAPVKILVPNHPVFNFPNKIVDSDWDNWVQERNLYCLTDLSSDYTPLLETKDDDEAPAIGGLVHAKIGKGHYVYNSYSFFRQLTVGNPGAYRVFANLLSLPKAK